MILMQKKKKDYVKHALISILVSDFAHNVSKCNGEDTLFPYIILSSDNQGHTTTGNISFPVFLL